MRPKVLLLGLPGSGASTVGALLAQRLGWPFLDDAAVVERTGSDSQALTLLLGMPGELVAAVPESVVDDPAERERLLAADAHRVWLRCTIGILVRRVGDRLGDDPAAALRRLAAERHGVYEQLADQVVDTDAHPAGAAAKLIIEELESEREDH